MIYLIKFIFFLLLSSNTFANENESNQILFKINEKVFTNVDFDVRKKYVGLINNFSKSEFNEKEIKEIFDDYVSALIFYEYYIQNKIVLKNLNDEINNIYKEKFPGTNKLNQIEIEKFKFNTYIDLIRNKIIEEKLNSKKTSLLQEVNKLDLLYNYNLQHIIIKDEEIDKELIKNVNNKEKFNNLKKLLIKNKINFFYKEDDINDNSLISNKIKNIINQNIELYIYYENGYINIISISKNLESYDGIFVKLINFSSNTPKTKQDLQCDKFNDTININKIIFKEYEYSKLNNNIKNNLKSINDYILFEDDNEYNYIILCDLTYDESILKNINFNKNVNSLVDKIQKKFLKKYKYEYNFIKTK